VTQTEYVNFCPKYTTQQHQVMAWRQRAKDNSITSLQHKTGHFGGGRINEIKLPTRICAGRVNY